MTTKKGVQEAAKSTNKQAAKKAAARPGARTAKADGENAVLAKIAAMPEPDRAIGERLHASIKADTEGGKSASQSISRGIAQLGDWRGDVLRRVRKLIQEADPGITEEVKWRKPSNPAGVPVWSRDGMICTGETYKDALKLTFAKGAALKDPAALFNSSLDGNVRLGIDIHEGDEIDESEFQDLVRAAVALNRSGKKK